MKKMRTEIVHYFKTIRNDQCEKIGVYFDVEFSVNESIVDAALKIIKTEEWKKNKYSKKTRERLRRERMEESKNEIC